MSLYAAVSEAIVVDRLEKRYGARRALEAISFSVQGGEIVGLLGPNGAGKSTTLSILACALRGDGGRVEIGGHPLPAEARAARGVLGYVPQRESLYPPLTARENLHFFGRMSGAGGLTELVACIVATQEGASGLAASVEARCAERLPRFKRPRRVVVVGALPRTPTGKLQRFRLREMMEHARNGEPG